MDSEEVESVCETPLMRRKVEIYDKFLSVKSVMCDNSTHF